METTPAPPKPKSSVLRVFLIVCAVIILLAGIAQAWKGVKRLRARNSPEFVKLVAESDKAVEEGGRYASEAAPLFQQMLKDVDGLGLENFRAQQKEVAAKTSDLFGKSIEQFRLADKKLEESRGLNRKEQLTPFLLTKSRSYDLRAETLEINQEIIRLILDDSIASADVLLPRLHEAAARRDEMGKKAHAANDEATEIGKRIQAEAKK